MNRRSGMGKGASGMVALMMALWVDPAAADSAGDDVVPRFTTGALVLWTLIGVALTATVSGVRIAVGGEATLGWLIAALAMVLPLLMAFLYKPPRRFVGLAASVVAGAVVGTLAGSVTSAIAAVFWTIFLGLAAGALVAALTFGLVTREPTRDAAA